MPDNRSMLVVDDEEVVCQVCQRIFSRQGFHVETNTDARRGLAQATEKDYGIILLDIKMPNMDGIQFLEPLRKKKPDVPVLIITGYPSIPNAAAAMRLGASDYVTKPFTAEEITWAVQRVLAVQRELSGESPPEAAAAESPLGAKWIGKALFWDEAWVRTEMDGSACAGAVLPGLRGAEITGIRLPRIGEVVYQGLPLADVTLANKTALVVPSPVSGVVVVVNELLKQRPGWLASDPFGEGWLACICTTHHEEMGNCKPRRILLVNADPSSAEDQAQKLTKLGCEVRQAADRNALTAALAESEGHVVLLDAASLGDAGPELAGLINSRAAALRIVVIGSPDDAWETAYRKHKIFYYAVEPFSDNEIADILAAAFQTHETRPPKTDLPKAPSEPISSITITNRNGHKIQLMAAPGLLWRSDGLGCQIGQRLLAQLLPVAVTPGEAYLTPANILKTAGACFRLMVLLARDSGRIPGSLARDTKPEFGVDPGDAANKVTTLGVQPDAFGGFTCMDARTISALADHIVREMMSY
ncbi:MAG: response regulator [Thermoguttaceae bacterium]